MSKRMTRRQAQAWLGPIRASFSQMKSGEADSIRGYAVTRLHSNDAWERVDFCIAGFRCLLGRLFPGFDTAPLERVEKKLAAGTPLTEQELNECLSLFNRCESMLVKIQIDVVRDAVITEQIVIELEREAA